MTLPIADQPSEPGSATGETVLRHFVAFQFKEGVSPYEIAEVNTELVALKGRIPGILAVERGTNNSVENLSQGFTHGFLITFGHASERDTYLTHPAHEAFVRLIGPRVEKVFVFDYETPASVGR